MNELLHKTPPQNLEAEQSVLGAILLDNKAIKKIMNIVTEADFYRSSHQKIFATMHSMNDKSEPVDLVTLIEALDNQKFLEEVGGSIYISGLADSVPTAANVKHYAGIVKEKSKLRQVIETSTNLITRAYNDEASDGLINTIADNLKDFRQCQNPSIQIKSLREILKQTFKDIESRHQNKGQLVGLDTGFVDINKRIGGLGVGYHIIAGAPGQGKSVLAKDIACNVSVPVGIIQLEMTAEQSVERMLAASGVDYGGLQRGELTETDWNKLVDGAGTLSEKKIYIVDRGIKTERDVTAVATRMFEEHKIQLIIIDYFQLIRCSERVNSDITAVDRVSAALKNISHELKVPVIVINSLSREYSRRTTKRPEMSDLRGSGQLEHDADTIMFVWRPEYYFEDGQIDSVFKGRKKKPTTLKGYTEIIFAKIRNMNIGLERLLFEGQHQRFRNYIEEEMF